MSTQPMMFPSEWSERMAYEMAKAGYWPYDIEDLRHFCALRDLRIEELKADNTKLRELVQDMGELLDVLTECDLACKHYHDGCIGDCYYVNARRDLGVEVDG